jgi:hypothetical protein
VAIFDLDSNDALIEKEERSWWRLMVMQKHTIPSTKETIRSGFLNPSAPPAATVHAGDVVTFCINVPTPEIQNRIHKVQGGEA